MSLRRAPSVPSPALGAGPEAAEPVRAFAPHTDPTGPLLMNSSPKGDERQWPEAEMLNIIVVLNAIFQICKSTPGAAGPRSACGRAVGSLVPRDAGVPGDPGDGPVDGAVPKEGQEGLHQGHVGPFRVPAIDEAPADVGTVG